MRMPEPNDPAAVNVIIPDEFITAPALLTLPATRGFTLSMPLSMFSSKYELAEHNATI